MKTPLVSLVIAAALVPALSKSAEANTIAVENPTYAEEPWGANHRVEGRVGMMLGGSDVGDANGFAMGVSTGISYRVGDTTVRALLDHFRVGDGEDEAQSRKGRSTRIGGALRRSLGYAGDKNVGVDFWGELGAGYEHIAWNEGGVLDRPSGEIAVGMQFDVKGKERRNQRRRNGGYFMAFRTMFAQGPEMDGPAVCGGPCSRATKPSRLDLSMFFEIGVHWGR